MRGSGALDLPPSAAIFSAIWVAITLLPVSMRGPKRSMMVWKRPEAPVSKMGSHMMMPSASAILKNSQSKSSLWMHMLPWPLMSIFTQVMQPVQCLMLRSIARMNSTSQPSSTAPISASLQMLSLLPFLVPNRDTQNLCHGAPAFRHGFPPRPAPPFLPSDGRSLSPEMLCNCIEDWPRNALSLSREGHRRPPRPRRAPPGRVP